MKLIVGLGNPGIRYEKTKHNIGFRVVDAIYDRIQSQQKHATSTAKVNSIYNSLIVQTKWQNADIILAKPMTYMNNSGAAVVPLAHRFEIHTQDIIVIYDDVHLPLGALRIRRKGSDGGQKGMQSIIQRLGTTEIPRIRIGIGEPIGDLVDYVLSEFSDEEESEMEQTVDRAVDAIETLLESDILTAMNRFNRTI